MIFPLFQDLKQWLCLQSNLYHVKENIQNMFGEIACSNNKKIVKNTGQSQQKYLNMALANMI